jgi:putative membrane fusion protein
MKKATSIFILLFLVAAVGLFLVIYVMPKINGGLRDTVVLENQSLPVADKVEALIVRSETLYASPITGRADYNQKDGTKVRKGIPVMSVSPGGTEPGEDESEIAKVRETAGNDMVATSNFEAEETSVVCFTADGYEKKFTPETIEKLTPVDISVVPKEGVSLKSGTVREGNPVYKLTDNARWYIVFWINEESGSRVHYDEGGKVKVDFGDDVVDAIIDSISDSNGDFKVVLRTDKYYKKMMSIRHVNANIIFSEYKGLIIDAKSITLRGAQAGVFVKQRSGNFKWVPIQIDENRSTGEKYIASVGTYQDADGNIVRTVNYYDEILADPKASGYE